MFLNIHFFKIYLYISKLYLSRINIFKRTNQTHIKKKMTLQSMYNSYKLVYMYKDGCQSFVISGLNDIFDNYYDVFANVDEPVVLHIK